MPGKNRLYEITSEGYAALGQEVLSSLIQESLPKIETHRELIRRLKQGISISKEKL